MYAMQGTAAIAAVAHKPDDASVYRAYTAELQHGQRGARARVARKLGVSDQHVSNVVRRHEATRPVILPAQVPIVAPEPVQQATESLVYVPPPGGYAQPEPRRIAQNPAATAHYNPQPIHILSTPMPTAVHWQRSEFKSTPTWSPIANAKAAANLSYGLAVFLTLLLVPVMCKDARLLIMLPVLLLLWSSTCECQRRYRKTW